MVSHPVELHYNYILARTDTQVHRCHLDAEQDLRLVAALRRTRCIWFALLRIIRSAVRTRAVCYAILCFLASPRRRRPKTKG